jgi:hypothetical protein
MPAWDSPPSGRVSWLAALAITSMGWDSVTLRGRPSFVYVYVFVLLLQTRARRRRRRRLRVVSAGGLPESAADLDCLVPAGQLAEPEIDPGAAHASGAYQVGDGGPGVRSQGQCGPEHRLRSAVASVCRGDAVRVTGFIGCGARSAAQVGRTQSAGGDVVQAWA